MKGRGERARGLSTVEDMKVLGADARVKASSRRRVWHGRGRRPCLGYVVKIDLRVRRKIKFNGVSMAFACDKLVI